MCGVIGYHTYRPTKEHLFYMQQLFLQSKIRGLHASGFAYPTINNSRVFQVERFFDVNDTLVALKGLQSTIPNRMIGHTRYSTSGDFHVIENNQPLSLDLPTGQAVLAFNGVISMATKEEMELMLGHSMQTDNDGELFLRKLHSGIRPEDIIMSNCSFAGAWFHGDHVVLLRNKYRPLYTYTTEDGLTVYWASTKDILKRSFGSAITSELQIKELLPFVPTSTNALLVDPNSSYIAP